MIEGYISIKVESADVIVVNLIMDEIRKALVHASQLSETLATLYNVEPAKITFDFQRIP